jgi:hypothetical protein
LDAGNIYGSNRDASDFIREYSEGKLKLAGKLLPVEYSENEETYNFVSGNDRVNENIIQTVFVTLFVREHNRMCGRMAKI